MTNSYTLKVPVKHGSDEITALTFRKAKARDFRELKVGGDGAIPIGDLLDLAARLSDQAPSVIDELDPIDMMEVLKRTAGFTTPGQKTG
ncbi:phage tail assembly protein [Ferrovibrio terrae]|uniref:phage tail assembly protein n=1 Tax=Ferrovibrio terrae TaxID=2594003 RepID=UPI0031383763